MNEQQVATTQAQGTFVSSTQDVEHNGEWYWNTVASVPLAFPVVFWTGPWSTCLREVTS